jgi:hypothetical protein
LKGWILDGDHLEDLYDFLRRWTRICIASVCQRWSLGFWGNGFCFYRKDMGGARFDRSLGELCVVLSTRRFRSLGRCTRRENARNLSFSDSWIGELRFSKIYLSTQMQQVSQVKDLLSSSPLSSCHSIAGTSDTPERPYAPQSLHFNAINKIPLLQ